MVDPAHVSRDGRDSLGRRLDPESIAAAVAADSRVREAKAEPGRLLERVYRDPHRAFARLEELIKTEGWTEAAARVRSEPEQLGRSLGRDGMFASRSAQLDRSYAVSATRSFSTSLTPIVEAEERAEREYRASITAQIARDRIGVPKLSAEAASVLEAVHTAARTEHPGERGRLAALRNQPAVARVWEDGRRKPAVAAEIDRFEKAASQRLGEEGIAAALRSA